jgi:mannan endo-1,4-beta-mannosidase
MYKNKLTVTVVLFSLFAASWAQQYPGFRVIGRFLYDKCGEKVILRGVANPNIWFQRNGLFQYEEIEKTGANVVRIVWDTTGTAAQLDAAISNCLDYSMIPMIECHDATGKWNVLGKVVDYWTRPNIVEVIQQYEEYLLLNIANECGDYSVSASTFKAGYEAAIKQIREAEIHVPLVIDGTDWGKNINILQSQGPYLIETDPDHNLLFSIHMWWPKMYGYKESDITKEITESVNIGLPLIVGEFSQMHGSCSDNKITDQNSVAYHTIIKQCDLNQVGWIAWSWFGNCNPLWDMTSEGTYETLYDWGLEVAVTDTYSIQNTSVRPYFIVNGQCGETVAERNTDLVHPTGFDLKQNFPNPFNSSTQIIYNVFVPSDITLDIYDIKGHQVRRLIHEWKSAGSYTVYWNGLNDSGAAIASGMYVCQITVKRDNYISKKSNKLILLK